jgi:tetratricopeptide (TPR) repeat protein
MHKTIHQIFIFILIFAPLSFGARAEWSFLIVSTCTLSGFLLLLLEYRKKKELMYQIPGILPLTLFLFWTAIQIVPFPVFFVEIISPSTVKLYKETIGIAEPVQWISLSINKRSTLLEFFRYTTYVIFYILTVQLFTRKDYLKKTAKHIVLLSTIIAILAILQYFLSADKIYWFRSVPENATPFGPYVYHNHYAGFMEMVFPLSLALFLYYRPVVIYGSFRQRVFEFFDNPKVNEHFLFGLSTIIIGASVFLSYSRGGIISLCISLCFLAVMLFFRNTRRESFVLFPMSLILILFSVGWFGWDFIFDRFEKIRNAEGLIHDARLLIWGDSMNIIRDFFLSGTGLGTFIDIYPGYRSVPGRLIFNHAHNDYLELFTNGGLIGSGLMLWFMSSIFHTTIKVFQIRKDSYSILMCLASMTGIISILLHSITDFNLNNGANGLYFFFMIGLMVSAAHTRLRVKHERTYLEERVKPTGRWSVILVSVLLVFSFCFQAGCVFGKYHFSMIKDIYLDNTVPRHQLQQILPIAYKASRFDPLNAQYYFGIGNIEYFLRNTDVAEDSYKKAIFFNPANAEYLQRLGVVLSETHQIEDAEKLFQAGVIRDKNNPESYNNYAAWLLSQRRADESASFFQKAMEIDLSKANHLVTIDCLEKGGAGKEMMLKALPQRVESFLYFSEYLKNKNADKFIGYAYQTAIKLLAKQKDGQAWHFIALCDYLISKGQGDEALRVMRLARDRMPENPWIRIKSGDLYHEVGIIYRAVEEYQKALSIDPTLVSAREKLSDLEK